jgi:hypothetical protein
MKKPFLISDTAQMQNQYTQAPKNLGGFVDFAVVWAENEDEALHKCWLDVFSEQYEDEAEFYEFYGAYEVTE